MWLALIMAFNVWFVIWPNQKRALGIVEADDATKAKSAPYRDDLLADQYASIDPDAAGDDQPALGRSAPANLVPRQILRRRIPFRFQRNSALEVVIGGLHIADVLMGETAPVISDFRYFGPELDSL